MTPVASSGEALSLVEDVLRNTCMPITVNSASFMIDSVGGGTVQSDLRSIGTFCNGNEGGELPTINRLDPQTSIPYTGGIGLEAGICLCTGLVTDSDVAGQSAMTGSGVGLQGPNNGFPISALTPEDPPPPLHLNAGETSFVTGKPRDAHLAAIKTINANNEGDAAALQFEITTSTPGFLRISFVFGSDEHPLWLNVGNFDVNDTMAVFVRQESCPNPIFKNIALLKSPGQPDRPMSLRELRDCGTKMFRDNQVVPAPDGDLIPQASVGEFIASMHGFDTNDDDLNTPDDNIPYYNHELGGFSKKLTRETPHPLAPGEYTIKIVVQDLFDRKVDSAVFLEARSLKFYELNPGDYNGDGIVDQADYFIWRDNFLAGVTMPTFYDGDGTGDCTLDGGDYVIWYTHFGETGNRDFSADFDRNGRVENADLTTLLNF